MRLRNWIVCLAAMIISCQLLYAMGKKDILTHVLSGEDLVLVAEEAEIGRLIALRDVRRLLNELIESAIARSETNKVEKLYLTPVGRLFDRGTRDVNFIHHAHLLRKMASGVINE